MSSRHLEGARIAPAGVTGGMSVTELVDQAFLAYNGGKLQRACQLFARRILEDDVIVGMSLAGALTPAGLGRSCVVPLIEAGFVDWIVSTGANLYHDCHHGLDLALHRGSEEMDDVALERDKVVRIYDILMDFDILVKTDRFITEVSRGERFQQTMSTADYHHLLGEYLAAREEELGVTGASILAAAYRKEIPVFVSSPGDSSIGLNLALLRYRGNRLLIDTDADVNQSTAIVWEARRMGGKSAAVIFGGGSPKNFLLQTEPQLRDIFGFEERGHDYFLQFTDARPDTGGLSGATPAEAVSWGKIDPEKLPDTVVTYVDSTIAMPILTSYALSKRKSRRPRRLMRKLHKLETDLGECWKRKVEATMKSSDRKG